MEDRRGQSHQGILLLNNPLRNLIFHSNFLVISCWTNSKGFCGRGGSGLTGRGGGLGAGGEGRGGGGEGRG